MSTDTHKGLSLQQVKESAKKSGYNISEKKSRNIFLQSVIDIIAEPMFVLLVAAALIYFILGETGEGTIMLVALIIVAGISFFQENRSRNAIDALKKLSASSAKVIRESVILEIPAEEIVLGDLIITEEGSMVPTDARIIELHDFSVSESMITGESVPVLKDLTDSGNRIYQGTMVMSGSCIAEVTEIGNSTVYGKIGKSLSDISTEKTPLQNQIRKFVKVMVIFGAAAFLIVWGINFYLSGDIMHGLLQGLTLAMSVLPEEIPVAFSTFMALGAYKLYKEKVIAKFPKTVETLGSATVICIDKTGTITENKMEFAAAYIYSEDRIYDLLKEKMAFNEVVEYSMWASEPEPFDPMENTIHSFYKELSPVDKRKNFEFIYEYPLSGNPPMMTHIFQNETEGVIVACKGGVESVLQNCILPEADKKMISSVSEIFAKKGYRVLGVAKSVCPDKNFPEEQSGFDFTFLGLVAFYDPPKKNISKTLESFYSAGIKVKMITGDFPETAGAIAEQVNFRGADRITTGNEVIKLEEKALQQVAESSSIFARMFPEAKLKIINALKANGEIVAMTGDGVNDAPAMKASHIGIAMGRRGSEITKSTSSMILIDDDLSRMVTAIAIGRRIYENFKKAVQYIISIHIPIILIVTLPLVLFWEFRDIFSPVHVIFLELIMGPTCSIIYENEPIEANSMKRPPRKMSGDFLSGKELLISAVQGAVITAGCLAAGKYFFDMTGDQDLGRTMVFTTLIFSNLFLTLVNRSFYYSIFTTLKYKNNLIFVIISISLVILFSAIYFEPAGSLFRMTDLSFIQILICLITAMICTVWIEIYKLARRHKAEKSVS
ncbi:MAG: cation-translocating P-type ATPase [Bacteroidetes bacterium]|nr:cation-translocating P-type ATPase [Bacteroidota bacterium]